MKEETPFENCCAKLEIFGQIRLKNLTKILFKFSGRRIVFEICFYEIDERFPTGLVIFGVVFN